MFRPERFLDNDGKLLPHDRMIPFGLGKIFFERNNATSFQILFPQYLETYDKIQCVERTLDLKDIS